MKFSDIRKKYEGNKPLAKKMLTLVIGFLLFMIFSMVIGDTETTGVGEHENGSLAYVTRPEKGQPALRISAKAKVQSQGGTIEKEVVILVKPTGTEEEAAADVPVETDADRIGREVNQLVSQINEDMTKKKILLPKKLEGGETLTWQQSESTNMIFYFVVFVLACIAVYKSETGKSEKIQQSQRESVIRGLPGFTNQLILLLNAGLVTNSAFMKIMENHEKASRTEAYFYGQLDRIYMRVKKTNGVLQDELRDFSKRSGVPELMRISNIISDNMRKGTDLVEKLQRENEILWFTRKKLSEEKGRLAETKLTVPLVILLLVLVMVTVAPALMGM